MAEQLIRNEQVAGSIPVTSSRSSGLNGSELLLFHFLLNLFYVSPIKNRTDLSLPCKL